MTDDLMTPSQHIVSSNSPAKEIHEEFAMTCEYIMCKMKMYLVYVSSNDENDGEFRDISENNEKNNV